MSSDTDTFSGADLPTVSDHPDPVGDAETVSFDEAHEEPRHSLKPRVWAPMRVCPQCSLAWETEAEWCPGCGTAFDSRVREAQAVGEANALVSDAPVDFGAGAHEARKAKVRELGARARRHAGIGPGAAAVRQEKAFARMPPRNAAPSRRIKTYFLIATIVPVALIAFLAGQQTRMSNNDVNERVHQAIVKEKLRESARIDHAVAVETARLRADNAKQLAAARSAAYASGKQSVASEPPKGGGFDKGVKKCVMNFFKDC